MSGFSQLNYLSRPPVRMDTLENTLDEHWQEMSAAVQEKKRKTLKALRRERQEV
jgi:uncharacterized membrane protein (DUF106 family)